MSAGLNLVPSNRSSLPQESHGTPDWIDMYMEWMQIAPNSRSGRAAGRFPLSSPLIEEDCANTGDEFAEAYLQWMDTALPVGKPSDKTVTGLKLSSYSRRQVPEAAHRLAAA